MTGIIPRDLRFRNSPSTKGAERLCAMENCSRRKVSRKPLERRLPGSSHNACVRACACARARVHTPLRCLANKFLTRHRTVPQSPQHDPPPRRSPRADVYNKFACLSSSVLLPRHFIRRVASTCVGFIHSFIFFSVRFLLFSRLLPHPPRG